jgi:hypothetical protein
LVEGQRVRLAGIGMAAEAVGRRSSQ